MSKGKKLFYQIAGILVSIRYGELANGFKKAFGWAWVFLVFFVRDVGVSEHAHTADIFGAVCSIVAGFTVIFFMLYVVIKLVKDLVVSGGDAFFNHERYEDYMEDAEIIERVKTEDKELENAEDI